MFRVPRLPTENQVKIVRALAPYLHSEALPYGIFAKIRREVGVTDCYVAQIFERLREDLDTELYRSVLEAAI